MWLYKLTSDVSYLDSAKRYYEAYVAVSESQALMHSSSGRADAVFAQ